MVGQEEEVLGLEAGSGPIQERQVTGQGSSSREPLVVPAYGSHAQDGIVGR